MDSYIFAYRGIRREFFYQSTAHYLSSRHKEDSINSDDSPKRLASPIIGSFCLMPNHEQIDIRKILKSMQVNPTKLHNRRKSLLVSNNNRIGLFSTFSDIPDLDDDQWILIEPENPMIQTIVYRPIYNEGSENITDKRRQYPKLDFPNNDQIFVDFMEIEDFMDEELLEETEHIEQSFYDYYQPLQTCKFEFYSSKHRRPFVFSISNENYIKSIQDIKMKRDIKQAPKITSLNSSLAIQNINSNIKETVISTKAELKRFSDSHEKPQKSVTFAKHSNTSTYPAQYDIKLSSTWPLKIFLNKQSRKGQHLLNSLQLRSSYAVGLETNNKFMDCMDLIIAWQTGVKFADSKILSSESETKQFLESIHPIILSKFDQIFLFFVNSNSCSEPGRRSLEDYQRLLSINSINFLFYINESATKHQSVLQDYLEAYILSIKDKDHWRKVQETISDAVPMDFNNSLNIYSFQVITMLKSLPKARFLHACANLGATPVKLSYLSSFCLNP
jgi:hypothetical protein